MKLLERHRVRREQNLPTISCFIGSIDEARRAFAEEGGFVEVESATALLATRPLWRDALLLAARASRRFIAELEVELPAKGAHERGLFFRTIDLPEEARALIEAWCEERPPPDLDLSQLARIVSRDDWPGVFLVKPTEHALVELARLVEALPFLRVAVVIEEALIERMPPRAAALLREGLIRTFERSRELAKETILRATEPEQAKSAAELFLYEVLQSMADTRDVFALNARMDFVFGRAPAEIDLAAESRRIAIEIDGYFHFQDADAYRRDRRKDLLLQTRGWWVLRFLAEDVVVRLEETLATIRHALTLRSGGIDS